MYKTTGGIFKASGPLWLVAFATLLNLILAAWTIYLVIMVAKHVNAWPF